MRVTNAYAIIIAACHQRLEAVGASTWRRGRGGARATTAIPFRWAQRLVTTRSGPPSADAHTVAIDEPDSTPNG